jgi:hypothetical protein
MRNKSGFAITSKFGMIIIMIVSFALVLIFFGDSISSVIGGINAQVGGKIGVFVKQPGLDFSSEQEAKAEAGPEQYACIDENILFDGSKSTSAEDDPIAYYYWNYDVESDPDDDNLEEGEFAGTAYRDIFSSKDYEVKLYIVTGAGRTSEDTTIVHVIDKCVNVELWDEYITNDAIEKISIAKEVAIKKADLIIQAAPDVSNNYPTYLKIDIHNDDNPEWAKYNIEEEEEIIVDLKQIIQDALDASSGDFVELEVSFETNGEFLVEKLAIPYEITAIVI